MSALPPLAPRDRRRRWLSLMALLALLPAALWVRSHGSVAAWRDEQELEALITEPGKSAAYGGAEWRLEGLYQLPQKDAGSAIILAEFEARIEDPQAFANSLCRVHLGDRGDKRWAPQFLMPSEIRKARPGIDERTTCASAMLKTFKAGDMAKMAETFQTPAGLTKFDLIISAANIRPAYLVLR